MGDASETRRTSTGMENLCLQTNRFPRDLLQRFMGSDSKQSEFGAVNEEEIELNLGLSLGGRFGVDKSDKKLMRSSSVAGFLPIIRDDDAVTPPPTAYSSLVRTTSLPVEMEEEWRKRKELQSLRRMEAKRRRSEKQKSKDNGGGEEERREIGLNLRGQGGNRFGSLLPPSFGLPTWAATAAARQAFFSSGIDVGIAKAKGNHVSGGGSFMQGPGPPSSQGSMESQGGSSSSMSELESKHLQGSSSCGEVSPASIQSLQEQTNQEVICSSGAKTRENTSRISGTETENSSRRADVAGNKGKEIGMNSMEDMPCVFTVGDGPNGRKIDGILYKYGKGEEVRIMCVCHGSFLSPAEFVKHAGGGDVAHPLKHIVINPNSPSLL